ncbi:hypothetical protein ACQ4PT_004314 [Festuca glaucescens]
MDVTVAHEVAGLFNASDKISVGDGSSLLFWQDPWIDGLAPAAIAPAMLALVKPCVQRRRTVRDGLLGHAWATDIASPLSVDAIVQYLRLWSPIAAIYAGDGHDQFRFKWTSDGAFTSRSAYLALFEGTTTLPGAANVWNVFSPLKFKFHAWLALRGRC